MKRIATTMIAAAMAISPMAITSASAQDYGRRGDGDYNRDRDRDYNRDRDRDGDRDWNRRDRRHDRGRHRGWDRRQHNGYYLGSRWYYGPPPSAYYNRSDFRPDYRNWRRGDRLPAYYRSNYVVVNDYGRYRLRAPPRGYHYVRDDRGDILLAAIATGIILSVIANH